MLTKSWFQIAKSWVLSQPTSRRRIRRVQPLGMSPELEWLESRSLPTAALTAPLTEDPVVETPPAIASFTMDQIAAAYNAGRADVQQLLQFLVKTGLGQDLPLVQETVGDLIDAVDKFRTAFENNLSGTQEQIDAAITNLQSAGFTLQYLAPTADANGDLLRISYDRTYNTDHARLNVAGATGLDYFDKDVDGNLNGSFNMQSPTVKLHLVFGIDIAGATATASGAPTFYIGDTSSISFDGLNAEGQVKGDMSLRYLANVTALGTLKVALDGSLNFVDPDSDHKLRISDLSNASSIRGDVDGTVALYADLKSNVPLLNQLTWHGDWNSVFTDGQLQVGSPTFELPNVAEVSQAVINGFVGMKNDFDFLGPLAGIFDTTLPVLGTTLGDETDTDSKLGWQSQSIESTREILRQQIADIDLPKIEKLINGEKVDLISFQIPEQQESLWQQDASFLFAAVPVGPLVVSMSGEIHADVGWDWSVGFGVDTTGVWIDSGTHIGLYGSIRGGLSGELSFAGLVGASLEAGVGLQLSANIGLRDPDPTDGHIYMDELIKSVAGNNLTQAIGNITQININLTAAGYVRSELHLPWPLPDITLFDESFVLGTLGGSAPETEKELKTEREFAIKGQGAKDLPAVLQPDGTLVITGTSNRDFISLSSADGDVSVKSPGYRDGSFQGVRKVVFNGCEGDDQLTVAEGFDIPIEANGGNGDDFLMGGTQSDTLNGGAGNDQLYGKDGADLLNGDDGNDSINGGLGNDLIFSGSGNDLLQGGSDDDYLDGEAGNDDLEGNSGNDVLQGSAGNDLIYGGSGNDTLNGDKGDDTLCGDDGNDQLFGGLDNDALSGGANDDLLYGGDGDDTLAGDGGRDFLYGEVGKDILMGGDGDDLLDGGTGNDRQFGESGQDELRGGDGDDELRGGVGDDILRGGNGIDTLNGDAGADDINGEAGEDILVIDLSTSAVAIQDKLAGGVDRDTLWISPTYNLSGGTLTDYQPQVKDTIANTLDGLQQSGPISGNPDDKKVPVYALTPVQAFADQVNNLGRQGTGNNWIILDQTGVTDYTVTQRDPITGQVIASVAFQLNGGADTDIETLTMAGADGDDRLEATPNVTRNLILNGGDGNDTLIGGGGRDVLLGGAGNDLLTGKKNDDELHGGTGNDTLNGGDGSDRLYGDEGDDSLNGGVGFDVQYGGLGNDTLVAGDGPVGDQMYGGAGNDTILGGDGIDVVDGESGDDTIRGGKMADMLVGGDGNDTVLGEAGRDIIFGNAGDDVLWASDGSPELNVIDPNWVAAYNQLLVRKTQLITSVIPQLEIQLQITDPALPAYAELVQQRVNAANELVLISYAELSNNPYQDIALDTLDGGDGNDELHGSYLKDKLIGGAGDDSFYRSAGDDLIIGGEGNNDAYFWDATDFDDVISIGAKASSTNLELTLTITNNGPPQESTITLSPDVETIGVRGLGGNDSIFVNLGSNALMNVILDGGTGNDLLDAQTLQAKATLIGGPGNDTLQGGLAHDRLFGGDGDDWLVGNGGTNELDGGDGRDYIADLLPSDSIVDYWISDVRASHLFQQAQIDAATYILLLQDGRLERFQQTGAGDQILDVNITKFIVAPANSAYANRVVSLSASGILKIDGVQTWNNAVDFTFGADGSLYLLGTGGQLQRLARTATAWQSVDSGVIKFTIGPASSAYAGQVVSLTSSGVLNVDGKLFLSNTKDFAFGTDGTFYTLNASGTLQRLPSTSTIGSWQTLDTRVVKFVLAPTGSMYQNQPLSLTSTGNLNVNGKLVQSNITDFAFKNDGSLYTLSANNLLTTLPARSTEWQTVRADITKFAIAPIGSAYYGHVFTLNAVGELNEGYFFRWNNTQDFAFASDGALIVLNTDGVLARLAAGTSDQIIKSTDPKYWLEFVYSGYRGGLWTIIDSNVVSFVSASAGSSFAGKILSLTSANTVNVNGIPTWTDTTSLAMADDRTVYRMKTDGKVYQSKPDGSWQVIPGLGSNPISLGSDGTLYQIEDGQIYHRKSGRSWEFGRFTALTTSDPTMRAVQIVATQNGLVSLLNNGATYFTANGQAPGAGTTIRNYDGTYKATQLAGVDGGVVTLFSTGVAYFSPTGLQVGGGGSTVRAYSGSALITQIVAVAGGVDTLFENGAAYYSPNGRDLGGGGTSIRATATTAPKVLQIVPVSGGVDILFSTGKVYFSPDGKNLDGGGNTVRAYDGTQPVKQLVAVGGGVDILFANGFVYFSPDGSHVDGGGNTIRAYSKSTPFSQIIAVGGGGVVALLSDGTAYYSPDGRSLDGGGKTIRAYEGSTRIVQIVSVGGKIKTTFSNGSVYLSPDGRSLGGGGLTGRA